MINLANSHSLTDFQRNARRFIEELNQNQEPLLVTVNGKVQAVLLDPQTFQAFENFLEQEKFVAALQEGLNDLDEGNVRSLDEVKAQMKAKYGL
jgi:PHD/YefM family antitoxin component YafN of YafNO toxin-antitoxin module